MQRRVVSDFMNPDVVALRPDMTVREAEQLLARRRVSGAPVVDGHGRVLGVISQNDLVRHQAEETTATEAGRFFTDVDSYRDLAQLPVERWTTPIEKLMTRKVYQVARDTGVAVAANIMRERRIHRLLVTDRSVLVGIVSSQDLLRLVEEFC